MIGRAMNRTFEYAREAADCQLKAVDRFERER
jgi:hypothetical protein